jgi:hypothetical protein
MYLEDRKDDNKREGRQARRTWVQKQVCARERERERKRQRRERRERRERDEKEEERERSFSCTLFHLKKVNKQKRRKQTKPTEPTELIAELLNRSRMALNNLNQGADADDAYEAHSVFTLTSHLTSHWPLLSLPLVVNSPRTTCHHHFSASTGERCGSSAPQYGLCLGRILSERTRRRRR